MDVDHIVLDRGGETISLPAAIPGLGSSCAAGRERDPEEGDEQDEDEFLKHDVFLFSI